MGIYYMLTMVRGKKKLPPIYAHRVLNKAHTHTQTLTSYGCVDLIFGELSEQERREGRNNRTMKYLHVLTDYHSKTSLQGVRCGENFEIFNAIGK